MRSVLLLLALIGMSVVSFGCALCQSPYDYCYSAYGGSCCAAGHGGGRLGSLTARRATIASEAEEIVLPGPE